MTLRTTAIIAGALGLLMLISGLIAQAARPAHAVVTEATLATPVVVLGPEVLALPELHRLAVTADGGVDAHTARPVDAEAWLVHHSATYITGYASWEEFTTRTASRIVADAATPSPGGTADAAPAAAATPSPSPDPAEAVPGEESVDYGSGDIWRHTWTGEGRVSLAVAAISPGEYLVVNSTDGADLGTIEVSADRQVNDAWISPLIWIGIALAVLGLLAVLSAIVDVRPLQERVEAWTTKRSRIATGEDPKAGSRRERRLAGSTLPDVDLEQKGDES
ncbi:hypothetical protein [Demequina sp.]|uniref:hypothetical protein n=1 Tax=Demequina sp. TaxID=2050685 RepID=UPI0025BACB70|nr:hypothetical protein [Demequina sp.]